MPWAAQQPAAPKHRSIRTGCLELLRLPYITVNASLTNLSSSGGSELGYKSAASMAGPRRTSKRPTGTAQQSKNIPSDAIIGSNTPRQGDITSVCHGEAMSAPDGVRVRLKARPIKSMARMQRRQAPMRLHRSSIFRQKSHRADLLLLRCNSIAMLRLGGCLAALLKEPLLQGQLGLAKVDAGELLA